MSVWKRMFGKKDSDDSKAGSDGVAAIPPSHTPPGTAGATPPLMHSPGKSGGPVEVSKSDPLSAAKARVVRVFISSTFRDMQKERELLVKQVFPELRRVCDERFVAFTEVDLRWGITQEQQAEGKVLPICLEEIHTCRPYFIGILGERYGWIPNTVPPEVLAKEPWIQEHVGQRTSVTELEILHGVLRNKAMAGHAFFYFRDPAYIASLPAGEQPEMVERDIPDDIKELGPAEATLRTRQRMEKLAALKETIRQSHLPLVDPYATPETLAAVVRKQFLDLIDKLYPKEQVPDPLDQEAIGHRTYAQRKLLACIDRPAHLAALDSFASAPGEGKGIVVTGDSGGGKTALLAAWVNHYRQNHPGHFVLEHYFGATSESASVPRFLHRLLGELKRLANIPDEIPSAPEKMAEVLPLWLAQTTGKSPRIVLVLDALNQIEGEASHRNLSWLPRFFPAHVRVIVSSLAGPALDTLGERGWTAHPLPLADADERGRMIDAFLRVYRKELGPTLRNQIVNAPGSANPLFLRTVLEELRQFGDFEKLPTQVGAYLTAASPVELFRQVIRRWQADFHAGRDVVGRSLRFLWAARQGLGENEWLDLLADEQGEMDRQTWRPLFLALATHLVQRSGLWALGHDYLKQAIEAELLPTEEAKKCAHLAVADYFESHPSQREMTPRKAVEWPHQLQAAGSRDRLRACLLDIDSFLQLVARDSEELRHYWIWLKEERTMGRLYVDSFEVWVALPMQDNAALSDAAKQMGFFLNAAGLHGEAESICRWGLIFDERVYGRDHPKVAAKLSDLALLLEVTNRTDDAAELYRRALAIDERNYGPDHPSVARDLNNLALLLKNAKDPSGAEAAFRRALGIARKCYSQNSPDTASYLCNLGSLLAGTGRVAEGETIIREALAVEERHYGDSHPNVAMTLSTLGVLLHSTLRWEAAERCFRRALAIDEECLGKDHHFVGMALFNLACLLHQTMRLEEAQTLMRRAVDVFVAFARTTGYPHPNLRVFLNTYARLLQDMGWSRDEIRARLLRIAPEFLEAV